MSSPTSPAAGDTIDDIDVVDLLISDHRAVETLFTEIESLLSATDEGSLKRVKDLTEQVTIELVKHSVAEEAAVYPRIAKRVSPEEAGQLRDEQAEAASTMKRLEKLQPENPDFQTELHLLMEEIRAHVTEEEGDAFPQLRTAFSHEKLV